MGVVDFQAGLQGELMRRALAAAEDEKRRHAMSMDLAKLGIDTHRLDQDASQFDATLGLNRDKLGEDVRQFDAAAPQREAQTGFIRTQTNELLRKPTVEAADRAHDVDLITRREGSEGRLITQRGAEERRTKQTPDAKTAAAVAATGQPSPYQAERNKRTSEAIADLKNDIGILTTGPGSMTSIVPGTPARDFAAKLNTVKANIAFGELAAMREASKTGGALGAISERELALLESALGALDAGQSPSSLKEQLGKIEESLKRWNNASGTTDTSRPQIAVQEYDFVNGKLVPRAK